jgi:transposase-like protein
MDRALLEAYLEEGLSLEQIGERIERHPSTVGYWIKKHGLQAAHHHRFAPRGGLTREQLAPLVEAGLTVREIASRLDRSPVTVRHWLRRYALRTRYAERLANPPIGPLPKETIRTCIHHGDGRFVLEGRGYYRCAKCRSEQVSDWRRRVKERLVAESGGSCSLCGYDRYLGALEFHHLDPATKDFNLSLRGVTRSMERLRAEVRKCVLLCANCHAEVEGGIAALERAA